MLVFVGAFALGGCGSGAGEVSGERAATSGSVVVEEQETDDARTRQPDRGQEATEQRSKKRKATVSRRCAEAMRAAHKVDAMQDTHDDLFPAFDACRSVTEFRAASKRWPDALDGADPAVYVKNVCLSYPEVGNSRLCKKAGA